MLTRGPSNLDTTPLSALIPKAAGVHLRTTIGVHRDLPLIPHFLEHYRALGVSEFRVTLHAESHDAPELADARALLREHGLEPQRIWVTAEWDTAHNLEQHRLLVTDLAPEAWVLSADIDEFHEYPASLPEFVATLTMGGYNTVHGRLVQRVARNFRLNALLPVASIQAQFPIEADFRIGNCPHKVMLHHRAVLTGQGHHTLDPSMEQSVQCYPVMLKVGHFKWFEGVDQKYTNPRIMAHHTEVWEFSAFHEFIQRNFYGWRRVVNCILYRSGVMRLVPAVRRAHRMWLRAAHAVGLAQSTAP